MPKGFGNFQRLEAVLMASMVLLKKVDAIPKGQLLKVKGSICREFNHVTKSCIFKIWIKEDLTAAFAINCKKSIWDTQNYFQIPHTDYEILLSNEQL